MTCFVMVSESKYTAADTFLDDSQKMHAFKNIVFLGKCPKVLDRRSIPESKMTTCVTFLKGSDMEFDSKINKYRES